MSPWKHFRQGTLLISSSTSGAIILILYLAVSSQSRRVVFLPPPRPLPFLLERFHALRQNRVCEKQFALRNKERPPHHYKTKQLPGTKYAIMSIR